MENKSYTATIEIDNSPLDVFNHVNNVSKWWTNRKILILKYFIHLKVKILILRIYNKSLNFSFKKFLENLRS